MSSEAVLLVVTLLGRARGRLFGLLDGFAYLTQSGHFNSEGAGDISYAPKFFQRLTQFPYADVAALLTVG